MAEEETQNEVIEDEKTFISGATTKEEPMQVEEKIVSYPFTTIVGLYFLVVVISLLLLTTLVQLSTTVFSLENNTLLLLSIGLCLIISLTLWFGKE